MIVRGDVLEHVMKFWWALNIFELREMLASAVLRPAVKRLLLTHGLRSYQKETKPINETCVRFSLRQVR
jgi:hypothetical protein